jgi:MtN3 and saliva related transmembrane protein
VSDVELIGLLAGLLVAAGLVPQILRVLKLRDAQEISLLFNLLTLVGTVLWLGYGITLGLTSVIIWNATNTVLLTILLMVKVKYGMKNGTPQQHQIPRKDS